MTKTDDIDYTQYPKIYPYVKDLIGKSHFRRTGYGLDDETYIEIISEWVDFYEKNVENAVANTMLIYELTCGETGYSALGADWKRRAEAFKLKNTITEDLVRIWWREKFVACIAHLRQGFVDKTYKTLRGGATGCFITCSFTVEFMDSELKRVKKTAVSNLSMHLNIGVGLHSNIDIPKSSQGLKSHSNKLYMTSEDLYIRKIEGAIRGIRLGTKEPKDVAAETAKAFANLKTLNVGMHDDLMTKYKNVTEDYKNRKK